MNTYPPNQLCAFDSCNDGECAIQLSLPFSYEDMIDLPLIKHGLSVVFMAFTHSRSS